MTPHNNNGRQATDKQISYITTLIASRAFKTDAQLELRYQAMQFVRASDRPIGTASRLIGFMVKLPPNRAFQQGEKPTLPALELIRVRKVGQIRAVDADDMPLAERRRLEEIYADHLAGNDYVCPGDIDEEEY